MDARLSTVDARLSTVDARLSDIDRQQGGLWESSVRQSVRDQFGHSFAKEFAVVSLQHLAKLLCRSTGWVYGSDPADVCRVAEKLAQQLSSQHVAERLLQDVSTALVQSAKGKDAFADVGRQLQANPWFDRVGNLDTTVLGRSLPAFAGEERETELIKNKLQKLHRSLSATEEEGQDAICCFEPIVNKSDPKSGGAERISHLLTCRSAGVMLALYASQPSQYDVQNSTSFKQLSQRLPFLQLQLDVRGKIVMIKNQVTIEVGEIKRNIKQYKEAKHQLVQRAKLLQWAMTTAVDMPLEFVLIGHLFVPRGKPDERVPDNEVADDVSIFTHQL